MFGTIEKPGFSIYVSPRSLAINANKNGFLYDFL